MLQVNASMPMTDLDSQIRLTDFPKDTQDGWSQNPTVLLDIQPHSMPYTCLSTKTWLCNLTFYCLKPPALLLYQVFFLASILWLVLCVSLFTTHIPPGLPRVPKIPAPQPQIPPTCLLGRGLPIRIWFLGGPILICNVQLLLCLHCFQFLYLDSLANTQ